MVLYKTKGGGICCYIKDNLQYEKVQEGISTVNHDYELLGITLCPKMMKKINLLAVYKNHEGKVSKLLDCLLEVAGRLNRSTTELIAIGDFNLDYLDRKVYNKHKLNTFMKSLAVEQLIKDYTRVTQTSRTMIDLIFSDCSHISCSEVMNINLSDHLPIYLIKKKERGKIYKKEILGRSYRNYDSSRYTALLDTVDWSEFDDEETPDRLWEIMLSNITKALDAICPIMKLMIP